MKFIHFIWNKHQSSPLNHLKWYPLHNHNNCIKKYKMSGFLINWMPMEINGSTWVDPVERAKSFQPDKLLRYVRIWYAYITCNFIKYAYYTVQKPKRKRASISNSFISRIFKIRAQMCWKSIYLNHYLFRSLILQSSYKARCNLLFL